MSMIAPLPEVAGFLDKVQGLRIGGDRVDSAAALTVENPSTGEKLAEVACAIGGHVDDAVSLLRNSCAKFGQDNTFADLREARERLCRYRDMGERAIAYS